MRLFVISALLFSCNKGLQEEIASSEKNEAKVPQKKTDKVAEAIDFLNIAFVDDTDDKMQNAAPGTTPQTVSFDKSKIDTVYDLPDEKNKPFLKLVVFKPKAYALVSAIKNVPNPPVLYYSAGKFDKKKPSIGLMTYLQQFLATATRSYNAPSDDALSSGKNYHKSGRTSLYRSVVSRTTTTREVLHLLKTYWDQGYPYNNTIHKKKGQDFAVGCVAVATGQIMAYHKKNTLKSYNWSKILDDKTNNKIKQSGGLADFLYDVAEGVKMSYGLSGNGGSGAYDTDAEDYLNRAGYKTRLTNYKYQTVVSELKQKRPVYLSGSRNRKKVPNPWRWFPWASTYRYKYSGGHAWVCDGYREVRVTKKMRLDKYIGSSLDSSYTYTDSNTTKYIHMNWGWGYDYSDRKNNLGWCTYNYWKI